MIQEIHKNHKEFLIAGRSIEHPCATAHAQAYGKQCLVHLQTSISMNFLLDINAVLTNGTKITKTIYSTIQV